ncbi:MAG: SusE domain-containing protein [Ferruginibacter sp.]
MKKIIQSFAFIAAVALVLSSCKKDENQVIFQGGTAPVLSASNAGPFVLLKDRKEDPATTLAWTNPNYMFNTGVSSQNVTYILQADSAGKNFSSPKLQEQSIQNDLEFSMKVKDLNSFFSKMELRAGVQHTIEMRIKASLSSGAGVLYSNTLTIVGTPYLDFAVEPPGTAANNYNDGNLWVIGDCFGTPNWTNPLPAPQDVNNKFTKIDLLHYELTINITSGGGYKMIQEQGVWGTQYHALDGSAGAAMEGSFEKRDADPQFPSPGAGRYKIEVNFQTGKYKLTRQ